MLLATALVINWDGSIAGFQDKVQIDPSEDGVYTPGSERHLFQAGPLTFGIVICHEGFRYPETVRWAAPESTGRFSPAFRACRARLLPADDLRRSGQFLSREGGPLPRGREHLLFRKRQLRKRGLSDDVGDRPPGRHTAGVPALRQGRTAHRGHRPHGGDRPAGRRVAEVEKKTRRVRY